MKEENKKVCGTCKHWCAYGMSPFCVNPKKPVYPDALHGDTSYCTFHYTCDLYEYDTRREK